MPATRRLHLAARREARHGYSPQPYRVVRRVNGRVVEVISRHATLAQAERKAHLR
jgi:hypothetical protein